MSVETFRKNYEQSTDNELAQVLADKQDLLPEAAEALDREVQRRQFVMPKPPQWTRQPSSNGSVESLEDYEEYGRLIAKRKTFGRYWYLFAMGPFVLGLVLWRKPFENSTVFITVTLSWALCVALYGVILNARFLGFKCPQCSKGFGRGAECFNCGFPRSMEK